MKTISALMIAGLLCLGGCSTPTKDSADTPSIQPPPVAVSLGSAGNQRRENQFLVAAPQKIPLALTLHLPEVPPVTEPDAVVKLDPTSGDFTPEMEARLVKIAGEVAKDDRLLIRLEGYVPSGGSPALDIGIAHKVLRKVRERLLANGVPPRRMLQGSFGGEHNMERDPRRHWVEIYRVRPSANGGS